MVVFIIGETRMETLILKFTYTHYTDKAREVADFISHNKLSERNAAKILELSKSDVHRHLMIHSLGEELNMSAKLYNVEKYVLLDMMTSKIVDKEKVKLLINAGKMKTRKEFKQYERDILVINSRIYGISNNQP